jgi:hypothetical protein
MLLHVLKTPKYSADVGKCQPSGQIPWQALGLLPVIPLPVPAQPALGEGAYTLFFVIAAAAEYK